MSFMLPDWLVYEIRERWGRVAEKLLALRRWINNQDPWIIISITGVTLVIFLIVIIGLISGPKTPEIKEFKKAWFYDLNTGKLFVAKSKLKPPIEAPSGPLADGRPAGVIAHVFTYSYEPNKSELFIGFLETTDPNAVIDISGSGNTKTDSAQSWGQGKLIRRVDDKRWILGSSKEARAILNEVLLPNENGERPCYYPPE
jgi:hypothetical protein